MRTRLVLLALLTTAVTMFAQVPVPGTFSTMPSQPLQFGTPVLSPPIATLGNGLSPAVVTTKQTVFVGVPQYTTGIPVLQAVPDVGERMETAATEESSERGTAQARDYFDFVVPMSGGTAANSNQPSLGDVARSMRKNSAPITGRKFTNEDIGRINQKYGNTAPPAAPVTPPGPIQ